MKETVLFGTYTKKTSRGIYQSQFDTTDGTLSTPAFLTNVDNPTYLAVSSNNFLYAIAKENEQGGIAVIDLAAPDKIVQIIVKLGTPPAHLSISKDQTILYSANYHEGTLIAYQIQADGTLVEVASFTNHGHGPKPEQDGSHLHYVKELHDGTIVACDLGTDEVFILKLTNNQFEVISKYNTEPGFGPRHIVFNNAQDTAYLAGELSSQVSVLKFENHQFEKVQIISSIPNDWTEHNGAAAIRIDSKNQNVYVSNRGFNSIAVFKIEDDTTLTLIQQISSEGDFPRDFDLDSTEKFVLLANQNTDNATLYSRNEEGTLTLLKKDISLPEGVCVYFEK